MIRTMVDYIEKLKFILILYVEIIVLKKVLFILERESALVRAHEQRKERGRGRGRILSTLPGELGAHRGAPSQDPEMKT